MGIMEKNMENYYLGQSSVKGDQLPVFKSGLCPKSM